MPRSVAEAAGATASMVSPCLPWRKPTAAGGASGAGRAARGRAAHLAGASHRTGLSPSGDRWRAWASDKAELEDDRGRAGSAPPRAGRPVRAGLAGARAQEAGGGTAVGLDGRTSKLRAFESETFTGIAGLCNCSPRRTEEAPVPCPRFFCRRGAGVRGNGNCVHRSSDRLRPWLPRRSGSRYCG